jgi:hypothetical protein
MSKEFYLGNFDKDELKRLIADATKKIEEIEAEERLEYKPSISINETYLSKTSARTILRRFFHVAPGPNGLSSFDVLYVSCNGITYEEDQSHLNKDIDFNLRNLEWKKVDNSVYDMVWSEWEKMNDEVISVEATYGSNVLTKLNEL